MAAKQTISRSRDRQRFRASLPIRQSVVKQYNATVAICGFLSGGSVNLAIRKCPSPQINRQAAVNAPSDNHTLRVLLKRRQIERKQEKKIRT